MRKLLALEELENQIKEEREVETRYQQLDEQTRSALNEREGLTKRLSEERRLRKARRELKEARLTVAVLIEGTEAEQALDSRSSLAPLQSDGPQQLQSDNDLHLSPLQDAQKDSTHTSQPLPISIYTTPLTPSPFRPLPTTGRPTGRHPRQVMMHEESYVPPMRLESRRGEETSRPPARGGRDPGPVNPELAGGGNPDHPGSHKGEKLGCPAAPRGMECPASPGVEEPSRPASPMGRGPSPEPPVDSESPNDEPLECIPSPSGTEPLPGPPAFPKRQNGHQLPPPGSPGGYDPSPADDPVRPVIPRGETPLPVPSRGPNREADMMELLVASAYGIPKPRLPYFDSGRESDFVLLDMALGNLVSVHTHLSEHFKFQILLDHIKLPSAYKLAKSHMYAKDPYTAALAALRTRYGQPRQLVQGEINSILNTPPIKMGDNAAFQEFTLSVRSLVGLLESVEGKHGSELKCGSHADKLLGKLPPSYRDGFVEYCYKYGLLKDGTSRTYTIQHLSTWLGTKARARTITQQLTSNVQWEKKEPVSKEVRRKESPTPLYLTKTSPTPNVPASPRPRPTDRPAEARRSTKPPAKDRNRFQPYCPYHNNREHFFGSCPEVMKFTPPQLKKWIADNKRRYRCARCHPSDQCTLRKPCNLCSELHLTILHDISATDSPDPTQVMMVQSPWAEAVYLDLPNRSPRLLLKVLKVTLHAGNHSLDTFALLDDASSRTIILPAAGQHLHLQGEPEVLYLQTIRQQIVPVHGINVSFSISPAEQPRMRYSIHNAFTSSCLSLAEHSCPVEALKKQYPHLRELPLQPFAKAAPLVLIGSDFPQLIIPTEPVRMGPKGGPVAVHTALGWALQGPINATSPDEPLLSCLFTASIHDPLPSANAELFRNVELLWKLDAYPHRSIKDVTRSKHDKYALELLQTQTATVSVDGIPRYATPLLHAPNSPLLSVSKQAVMPLLRGTERRLARDPELANVHHNEIQKLLEAGYVTIVEDAGDRPHESESWYLPHHVVKQASGKHRLVFNCSFIFRGQSLNNNLLPGPTLGPSLLGVLLRFRQHSVAISGDIRAMFHQVRLLPQDRALLRFIWRNLERGREPDTYEWQVLPFGATCSPCCAIYALQCQARDYEGSDPEVVDSVENSFYVDNCLQSLSSSTVARTLLEKLRLLLAKGGFEIRQWASNAKEVIQHLPPEACSTSTELWFSQMGLGPQEPALGLRWACIPDTLGYKHRAKPTTVEPTLRIVYRTLASQYDPLGYILPYTSRAKVIVQDLWKTKQKWDNPICPPELMDRWLQWEQELADLHQVQMPRCYVPASADSLATKWDLHVYCDASEKVYGAVAYLRAQAVDGNIHVSFVLAKSRVAPRKQISMPRLELSAALLGAQLSSTLKSELTLPIQNVVYWSDSTTVLSWLKSESCRYKVFVGTRIAEIQDLTDVNNWRYVDGQSNPADDVTRGKTLRELAQPQRWSQGTTVLAGP